MFEELEKANAINDNDLSSSAKLFLELKSADLTKERRNEINDTLKQIFT